jgi:hypothetical protein
MNLTIDLPDDLGAALKAKALAQGVSLAGFTRRVLEEAVKPTEGQKLKPKKSLSVKFKNWTIMPASGAFSIAPRSLMERAHDL